MINKEVTGKEMTGKEQEELDRALNAALAKYAAVEPRMGLQERVLANLRPEQARVADRAWWRWVPAAAVVVLVVAIGLAWRSDRTSHLFAKHPPTTIVERQTEKQVANRDANIAHPPTPFRTAKRHRSQPEAVATADAKLDIFPSPQPLSEQEKILADYVAQYPERAALLAEARTEVLHRDAEERRQLAAGNQDFQP